MIIGNIKIEISKIDKFEKKQQQQGKIINDQIAYVFYSVVVHLRFDFPFKSNNQHIE